MPREKDRSLVTAWQAGDQQAGAELFRIHYASVLRFFHSKVGILAPDLVQRCFLRCLEIRDRIRDGGSFRCFLFGVARNVLLEHYRRVRSDAQLDFTQRTVEDLGPTPTTALAEGQRSQRLLAALQKLPVEQQLAVELYYWEGLTSREIGEICEVPEPTIRTRLRRARLRLEQEISELTAQGKGGDNATDSGVELDRWAQELKEQLDLR